MRQHRAEKLLPVYPVDNTVGRFYYNISGDATA